jgi:hypothetical protein
MKMNSRGLVTMSAIALVLVAAGCKKKDAAPAVDTTAALPAPEPAAPVALHVVDVSTGKGITADKNVANATDEFGVRDTIYAVVKTDGASSGAKLDAKWTYEGKQTVNTGTQNIAPTGGESYSEFHIQKKTPWPKGNYKVEVMLDGAAAGSKDFKIK